MNIKLLSSLLISSAAIPAAHAALIANGDLEVAVAEYSDASGTATYSLDASNNVISSGTGGSGDTGRDAGVWLDTSLSRGFIHSTTGGNGGTGGFIQEGTTASNGNPRGVLFFADDSMATTGLISATLDLRLDQASQFISLELYGWNDGQTGVSLSLGGSTSGNADSWNTTSLGDATEIFDVELDTTTVGAWETVNIGTADLGTGFDHYAWRLGIVGAADAAGDSFAFDNLVVTAVPEPSTTALLGLGGLALILRRRK
ncbi:hypothetical protein NT6N_19260 [Oceaniferula spumae]|uniref:Ice-binding protein C-terminal domain-containing protein n=1 Tax=Oceaniferula spumae TaxID=2979115 RepID=A0AAT9FLT7_9BACT